VRLAVGAVHDLSGDKQLSLAFEWLSLGKARIRENANLEGEYGSNDVFLLSLNLNWSKRPWSGRATFGDTHDSAPHQG